MAALNDGSDLKSDTGTKCEIRVLEERLKKNGEVDLIVKGEFKPSELDPHARFALVTKRAFDKDNALTEVTLQVNSFPLLEVFRDVIGFYPTIATGFDCPFEMEAPFGMLYHYWDELESLLSTDINDTKRMHLKLLLQYMKEELGPAREQNENMVKHGFVSFENMWTIFKPGELQYMSDYGHPRLLKLEKTYYGESKARGKYFEVKCSYVDYDGKYFGQAQKTIYMRETEYFGLGNAARITGLRLFPRRFEETGDGLETRLRNRGARFLEFTEAKAMRYRGKHEFLKEPPYSWYDPDWRYFPGVWLPREDTGQVVIDRKCFAEEHDDEQVKVLPLENKDIFGSRYTVLDEKRELDTVLCPSFVYGFSVQQKTWCRFYIDCLEEITWRHKPMDALILPERQKRILEALVTSHKFPTETREESRLKGKGLVILLHGTPGSGKTLTAETAAEATHKALLSITMSELNSNGTEYFERKLREFLRLATTWKAVVLIDEADVFLEHRTSGNRNGGGAAQTEKNALVAVFLKQLEYFQGIIFLTSNRVDVFDAAVTSRIHLALQYSPPAVAVRLELWRQRLVALADADELDPATDIDEVLYAVKTVEMNGREISNTVNTANTLARYAGEKVGLDHISSVVQVWKDFGESIKRMEEVQLVNPRQDSMVGLGGQANIESVDTA